MDYQAKRKRAFAVAVDVDRSFEHLIQGFIATLTHSTDPTDTTAEQAVQSQRRRLPMIIAVQNATREARVRDRI